ncbi:MAG: hypothetical protein JSV53_11905 [candidate division WOR-3 bacterium]|nr:MAG: hypothetical protein JSV53_11905 [candidate division WOR-3 bacterium]
MIFLLAAVILTTQGGRTDGVPSREQIYHVSVVKDSSNFRTAPDDTLIGDVIFELDVETPTGDCQLLGVEFDGTYFYVTGGANGALPNRVYVIDTLGNLILSLAQPAHVTGYWGWRDLAWDGVYAGAERIDTLYASFNTRVDKFGINFEDSTLNWYGSFTGPGLSINRALACKQDSGWFYTSNAADQCHKFSKEDSCIQSVDNNYYMYGAAYDGDIPEGGYVWWHSQDSTGTPFRCQIEQMEAMSMEFTGLVFDYEPASADSGIAGGLCYHEGFRGMDVLFALVQGDPKDIIVGIYIRHHQPGIAEDYGDGLAYIPDIMLCSPNPTRDRLTLSYSIAVPGTVLLRIYDRAGCLVRTLINRTEMSGAKTVYWGGLDESGRTLPCGVYFAMLETPNRRETAKIVMLR